MRGAEDWEARGGDVALVEYFKPHSGDVGKDGDGEVGRLEGKIVYGGRFRNGEASQAACLCKCLCADVAGELGKPGCKYVATFEGGRSDVSG